MLAKKYRFHRRNAVQRVYRNGQTARSGPLTIKYLRRSDSDDIRVVVVVSKKIDKRATVRNRIRRRIYEAVRQHLQEIKPGYDLVITVFDSSLATKKYPEIEQRLTKLLKTAGAVE